MAGGITEARTEMVRTEMAKIETRTRTRTRIRIRTSKTRTKQQMREPRQALLRVRPVLPQEQLVLQALLVPRVLQARPVPLQELLVPQALLQALPVPQELQELQELPPMSILKCR